MITLDRTPRHERALAVWSFVRDVFLVLALGAIVCYVFFAVLGSVSPGQVADVSIAVGVLVVLWTAYAWRRHAAGDPRDPRLRHARERRGF